MYSHLDMASLGGVTTATAPVPSPDATEAPTPRQREPREGAAFWLAMGGMATVGMTSIRAGNATLSDAFFLLSSGVIIVNLLTGARSRLAPRAARTNSPAVVVGLSLLTFGGLLATMLRSQDSFGSALTLVRLWYITLFWFWAVRSVAISLKSFKKLLIAAICGAVFHAGVGIYQDVSGLNAGAPGWGRSTGLSDHFFDLCASIGTLLPLVAVWPSRDRGPWFERLKGLAMLVMLGGMASSGSMTNTGASLIGVIVAWSVPWITRSRPRGRRVRLGAPILAAVLAVFALSFGLVQLSIFDRFGELTGQSGSGTKFSAESRSSMYKVAIDGAVRSPVVGVGLDERSGKAAVDFTTVTNTERLQIHSTYLRLLFEAGIFGLLGFAAILFVLYRQLLQVIRLIRGSPIMWLPAGLLGCMVTVTIALMFGPILFSRVVWLPMCLVSALGGLAKAGMLNDYIKRRRGLVQQPAAGRRNGHRGPVPAIAFDSARSPRPR